MELTRQYWEVVGVGVTLVLAAALFARPLLLIGAAGIFGWLLAMQVGFVHSLDRFDRSLSVEQSLTQTVTQIDEPLTATLSATATVDGLEATVRISPSAGLSVDGTETISIDETTVVSLKSPIAGTHTLRSPNISVSDTYGLFRERLSRGPICAITVQPREPNRVHIGKGGNSIPIAFGEHAVDTGNSGLVPAELREYTGDESLSRIDWKATARLTTPYVREFEAESDVTTILVIDRRGRLDVGPTGETAFEYLRSGALSYLSVVQSLNDPVGCFTVDDDRIEQLVAPTNSSHGIESLRRLLEFVRVASESHPRQRQLSLNQRSPTLDRETTFGRTLAAYTTTATKTPNTDPLPIAVRQAVSTQQDSVHLAVFTDDRDHAELRAIVSEAKRENVRLTLFLSPHSLYDSTIQADLETVNKRYSTFESFRRQLAAIDGVTAYEVAPRERIERVLKTHRPTK